MPAIIEPRTGWRGPPRAAGPADAAFRYFDWLAKEVSFFGDAVNGREQPYREVTDSAFAASQGLADLLHGLTDDVMLIIMTVASGGTLEVAIKLLHLLPEFVKHFLEKLGMAMAVAEILVGLAKNIQASSDLHGAAGYVYGSPVDTGPYRPPGQLVSQH